MEIKQKIEIILNKIDANCRNNNWKEDENIIFLKGQIIGIKKVLKMIK